MSNVLTEEQKDFLSELIWQYSDMLFKYAYRFFGYKTHMREIAEEAVQDTFLKAIEDVEKLMLHPNRIAWLKVSLRNTLFNIRREKHWEWEEPNSNMLDVPNKGMYVVLNAFDRFDRYPRIDELLEVVEVVLTDEEMETFYDHFLFGLTTEESAVLESVTKDTVRGRISRIRRKLRKHYGLTCIFLLLSFYSK